jgi:hypothetical protein
MQFYLAIAIVATCLILVVRSLARSIFPARFKAKSGGACGCSGGCPALKQTTTPPAPTPDAHERRPAA